MQLNTIEFMVIFIGIMFLFYAIPKKYQYIYLLVVSYAFYLHWCSKWFIILLLSTTITYVSGILINKFKDRIKCLKCFLALGIIINLIILIFFKYSSFAISIVESLASVFGSQIDLGDFSLILPLGISFYTFKSISYLMDVHKERISVEKNWAKVALYVSFFPQIMQGPIERATVFIPQLESGKKFQYETVRYGFWLFMCGVLKKVVFANRFAILADKVFDNVTAHTAPAFCIAILFYSFQIYFDFSGYSDMAIGCANMLGFESKANFMRPYFAKSIGEFWRKWHISLSTWFKDYLYIPLGGNRVSQWRWAVNIMIVFIVSGLWHGAAYNFIIWGALHGLYQVAGKITRKLRDKCLDKLGILKSGYLYTVGATFTTFALVAFAWLFFRLSNMQDVMYVLKSILTLNCSGFDLMSLGFTKYEWILSIIILVVYFVIEMVQERKDVGEWFFKQNRLLRWSVYMIILFTCLLFGYYGSLSASSFIYLQF